MKSKIFLIAFWLFSKGLLAQSNIIQPELFKLSGPGSVFNVCLASGPGKIFMTPNTNTFSYCTNSNSYFQPLSKWSSNGSSIYYLGKVGIGVNPIYDLHVNGESRFQTLVVEGNVGINTPTPTEKLDIVNRVVYLNSTADAKNWRIQNSDGGNRLEILEDGQTSMYVNYGGNIGFGALPNTNKLNVSGNVDYAGSLLIEGKGILSNTNSTQLVMILDTSTPTSSVYAISNNTCGTSSFSFPQNTFTAPPAVFIGQNISPITEHGSNLVKTIDSVTTAGGTVRICNNTGGVITFSNQSFSVIAIGQ